MKIDVMVVCFGGDHQRSGYAIRVFAMVRAIQNLGHRVGVLRLIPAFHQVESWQDTFLREEVACFSEVRVPPVFRSRLSRTMAVPYCRLVVEYYIRRWQPSIVQGEAHHAAYFCMAIIKPAVKVIVDFHGASAEEREYDMGGSPLLDPRYIPWLNRMEKYLLTQAGGIFVVSEKMITHLARKWGLEDTRKFFLAPIAIDQEFFNVLLKSHQKKQLGLEDKIVFVYSGGAQLYQCIKQMGAWFVAIAKSVENAHLLIVSPERAKIANELGFGSDFLQDRVTFVSVSKEKVPPMVACADFAFALRENHVINDVACPTKIGEYISQNIFLLCTENSGHGAEVIRKHNCGKILSLEVDEAILESVLNIIHTKQYGISNGQEIVKEYRYDTVQDKIASAYSNLG